eukprot:m.182745 g.182745  ORF g.182745 m.182745 type:complete len:385 (-) comp15535_c0_seq3:1534-2688(-)
MMDREHEDLLQAVADETGLMGPKRGRQGLKDLLPDESTESTAKLKASREEWCQLASATRTPALRTLSSGHWDENLQLVVLEKIKGPHFRTYGIYDKSLCKTVLSGDEALDLLEKGFLEVLKDGYPLTVQQAFTTLLPKDMSFDEFLVCSHLRNLGYIVKRYRNEKQEETNKENKDYANKTPADSITPSTTLPSSASKWGFEKAIKTGWSWLTSSSVRAYDWAVSKLKGGTSSTSELKCLLKQDDFVSYESMFSRLRSILSTSPNIISQEACSFHICLDVYKPTKKFKKTDPGIPTFRICVCEFHKDIPTESELTWLEQKAAPSTLKFAVVDRGSIVFFDLMDFVLPVYNDYAIGTRKRKRDPDISTTRDQKKQNINVATAKESL